MSFLDLFFPKFCRHCGESFKDGLSNILCAACFDSIKPYADPRCGHCGISLPPGAFEGSVRARCLDCGGGDYALEGTRAFGAYAGPLRLAHHAFKFEGMESLARKLAGRMAGEIPDSFWDGVAALVPVPLSPERERERGYHPARLLARTLAASAGKPLGDWLRKKVSTPAQMSLPREKRLRSLRGVFAYAGPREIPSSLVLVDDVLTTGATLEECAKTLRAAGCPRVRAVVFGRTPRNFHGDPASEPL
ncbi:MAG TPA: ComF family protein [bacterium]|nr:ComF family protein [bacterium]